jgi:hypothetical protein
MSYKGSVALTLSDGTLSRGSAMSMVVRMNTVMVS